MLIICYSLPILSIGYSIAAINQSTMFLDFFKKAHK